MPKTDIINFFVVQVFREAVPNM